MSENKLCTPAVIRLHENRDDNDDDGCRSPVDADLVDQIQVLSTRHIYRESDEHHSPKHENHLPLLGNKVLVP
jgi:hypothetical protein